MSLIIANVDFRDSCIMLSTTPSSLSAWPTRNTAASFWTAPGQPDSKTEETEGHPPSDKSDDVLNQLLQRNHDEHHIYYMGDDLRFNHLVHHLYVLKAFGGLYTVTASRMGIKRNR